MRSAWTEGERPVSETVEDSFRAERAQRRGCVMVVALVYERLDLGVGAKRPPYGGGPGAAQRSWAD